MICSGIRARNRRAHAYVPHAIRHGGFCAKLAWRVGLSYRVCQRFWDRLSSSRKRTQPAQRRARRAA